MKEKLLNHWTKVLGGLDNLKQIENIYTQNTIETGDLSGTIKEWTTAQGQHKSCINLGDVFKTTTGFDGKNAWNQDQNDNIRDLAGVELESEITTAYLGSYSHLFQDRLPGRVEYLGEDEAGTHYILKLLPHNGVPVIYHLDKVEVTGWCNAFDVLEDGFWAPYYDMHIIEDLDEEGIPSYSRECIKR